MELQEFKDLGMKEKAETVANMDFDDKVKLSIQIRQDFIEALKKEVENWQTWKWLELMSGWIVRDLCQMAMERGGDLTVIDQYFEQVRANFMALIADVIGSGAEDVVKQKKAAQL